MYITFITAAQQFQFTVTPVIYLMGATDLPTFETSKAHREKSFTPAKF